jgi:hypothetical protein
VNKIDDTQSNTEADSNKAFQYLKSDSENHANNVSMPKEATLTSTQSSTFNLQSPVNQRKTETMNVPESIEGSRLKTEVSPKIVPMPTGDGFVPAPMPIKPNTFIENPTQIAQEFNQTIPPVQQVRTEYVEVRQKDKGFGLMGCLVWKIVNCLGCFLLILTSLIISFIVYINI